MSIERPGLEQIDRSGAADGQVPVWDQATDTWKPGTPPATGVASVGAGSSAVTVDSTDPAHPVVTVTILEPLTTEIGGVPDLVWDSDNKLVMTEAH